MVDQMAAGAFCAAGHPAALTPNLDRLAASGVMFRNAYCNSPICVPARASFMTGNLARRTGVYDNGSELPASTPTLAHHLGRAGYHTILAGKMHFVGPDQLHGFNERLTGDISLSGLTLTPDWSRGAYPNEGSSVRRLEEPQAVDWTLQLAFDEEVLSSSLARLRKLRQEGDKFFLCASFSHPHDPFRITSEHLRRYDGVTIPAPGAPALPVEEMHPYNRWIQIHHEADRFPLDEQETEANRRAYLAMVSYVDDHVGKLLAELERLGLDHDTLVIFTSDHGEMLGEHGMWFKRTFYDAAAKVPLIVRWPSHTSPAIRHEVVSLVDLTATLLDVGEIVDKEAWLADMDGDSFGGLLDGEAGAGTEVSGSHAPIGDCGSSEIVEGRWGNGAPDGHWKNSAICEYYAEGTVEPMLFLRKDRYKYIYVNNQAPLLFDLEADPHELNDLAGEPAHSDLCKMLEEELLAGLDVGDLRRRIVRSQAERLAVAAATEDHLAWAYRPRRDALKLYGRAKR